MPELPEVTVIVNQLDKKLKGLVLGSIEHDWPKGFSWNGFSIDDLRGARVLGVRRLGKVVLIEVTRMLGNSVTGKKNRSSDLVAQKPSNLSILIHLKLTGQLIYQDAKTRIAGGHPIPPLNLPVPNKTTRVTFAFAGGGPTSPRLRGTSHLYFNDMRKFGWVKVVASDEKSIKEAIGKTELGPDPMTITYEQFLERIKKKPQARVKKLLMDQTFVSGVGNIYSDEALWRAKIHPKRSVASLTDSEIRAIYDGTRDSFKLAISKGGSSANSYVDGRGEKGLYLTFARAYHMTGKPCARCKTPIVREKMDGRSAHFCPKCQRLR